MMARALMSEILAALERLADEDRGEVIDLRSLPMSQEEHDELVELLGEGEVSAAIDSAGTTEVKETQFPGVWWVRHLGSTGNLVLESIEITRCPELLSAPRADITDSVREVRALLAEGTEDEHATG